MRSRAGAERERTAVAARAAVRGQDRPAHAGEPAQLWRVPTAGGTPQQLTTGAWSHRQGSPSRDGQRVHVFTYPRSGGTDVGYIGSVDLAPR